LIGNNLKRDNAIVSVLELRYGVDRWVPGQLPIARIAHSTPAFLLGIQQELAGAPGVGDCVAWLVQPALLAATAATAR